MALGAVVTDRKGKRRHVDHNFVVIYDFGSVEVEPYIPHIGRKNNVKSIDDVATQGIEEILKAVLNLDLSISFRKHEVHEDDIISLLIVPTGAASRRCNRRVSRAAVDHAALGGASMSWHLTSGWQ
jgi:hypothetical protein